MTTPVQVFDSPGAELARLLLELEAQQAESDRQQLSAARAALREAREQEVRELHAAADATELGAIVAGGLAAASGGLQVAGGLRQLDAAVAEPCESSAAVLVPRAQAELWQATGSAVGQLSSLASGLGNSASARRAADAQAARAEADGRAFEAEDAADHARGAAENHGRLLQQLREHEATRRAARNAVLENIG